MGNQQPSTYLDSEVAIARSPKRAEQTAAFTTTQLTSDPSARSFVEYYELRAAETALQTLNGRKIFDLEIKCNWAHQNQQSQNKEDLSGHNHLFVGDLPPEVTDDVLRKTFEAFGSLSDCRVMWDPATSKSRGYGFLAFREKADAEQAIATMNGEWLGSRAIRVNWANSKSGGEGGPSSGGGGGGGDGGHSRHGGGGGSGGGGGYGAATSFEAVVAQTPSFNSTIYVGNLVPYATQADLIPLFQGFGYLVEIRMQSDRGFAFVKLDSHQSAAHAIVNLQGAMVHGRGLKLSWGKDKDGQPGQAPQAVYAQSAYPQQQQQAYAQAQPYAQQQAYGYVQQQQQQAVPQDAAAQAAALAAWQAQYGAQVSCNLVAWRVVRR